jgi:hypothetical protein
MWKIQAPAAAGIMFLCGTGAFAAGTPPYTCGQYLEELGAETKSTAFYQAIGFTYGAYYMGNWRGDFRVDEEKLSRFDKSIVANCRTATGDSFFMMAMKTASDYRQSE